MRATLTALFHSSRSLLTLVLALAAIVAIPAAADALVALDPTAIVTGVGLALWFPVEALSQEQLDEAASPRGGDVEAVPDVIFDTQLFTSGTTTELTFFSTQHNDLSLSNLNGSGQLPAGNYFRPMCAGLDVLADATVSGGNDETGILDDIQKLLFAQRGRVAWSLNGKPIWTAMPISFLHTSGGAVGTAAGTLTAPNVAQVGNNSIPDGGFPVAGAIVISPLVQFGAVMTWAATSTLKAGNTRLRLWFAGVRYRPVV